MSSAPLRVGVVGVGHLGRHHARLYATLPGVELVAVADRDFDRAKSIAAEYGCEAFRDASELVGRVTAASVATPTVAHRAAAETLLAGGADVLIEKPIAPSLEDADAILEAARRADRLVMVGHTERFNPAMAALVRAVDAPLFVEIHRLAAFSARSTDVDVILDLMIHDLDLLLWFDGTEPRSVDAVGVAALTDKIDIANARIRFASGCVANVTASRISAEPLRRIRVFQSRTYLGCDTGARKVERFRLMIGSDKKPAIQHELLPVDDGEPLALELAAFVQAVRTRTPPPIDGLAGRRALELAFRVRDAIASFGPRVTDGGDQLGAFLADEARRGAMPGAAWWVGDGRGAVAAGFYGDAALHPDRIPLGRETPFDLASLTKPLATALLATIFDREGTLNLDTPMGAIFPELRASPFGEQTLRDAAAHRAGLPAWGALYAEATTREEYVNAIASRKRGGAVGEPLYSDLGYILLGFAVEKATGAPLDRLFAERIAGPLGLTRCGFAGRTARFVDAAATESGSAYERVLAGPSARADRFRTEIPRGQVHDGNAWGLGGVAGHAGLFGTAADVAAIARAILEPVRLGLDSGALDPMLRPAGDGAGSRTVGFLRAEDAESVRGILPDDAVGHWGFTGTSLWIDAMRPRIYVLLTNRVHPHVPQEPFTATRREFHRLASGA